MTFWEWRNTAEMLLPSQASKRTGLSLGDYQDVVMVFFYADGSTIEIGNDGRANVIINDRLRKGSIIDLEKILWEEWVRPNLSDGGELNIGDDLT